MKNAEDRGWNWYQIEKRFLGTYILGTHKNCEKSNVIPGISLRKPIIIIRRILTNKAVEYASCGRLTRTAR